MILIEVLPPAKGVRKSWWTLLALLVGLLPAYGQRFEITPLFGGRTGGTMDVQQEGLGPQVRARLSDSAIFGVAGGFRFDEEECEACSVIEFRWMRQNTHLGLKETTPVATPVAVGLGRTAVSLDHYLADFTHEWTIEEAKAVRPFIMATLGAARMSTPASTNTRFTFGLGAGVKVFPRPHWGFRFHAEYLPTVMHSEVQTVACISGCVVALGGGVMSQFEFAIGPVFRF